MVNSAEHCRDDQRRIEVRRHELNGIDSVDVTGDQRVLVVVLFRSLRHPLTPKHVSVEGGVRIRGIRVVEVRGAQAEPGREDAIEVIVDRAGDLSTYTLRIAGAEGFDPRYASAEFTFKIDCPSDGDCQPVQECPPAALKQPEINYLSKDYSSFRQLLLDRLSLTMPEWRERHVPDVGVALVEILAYAGDYLSYFQDAVATEAYLSTSRRRISVRRHVRLVDYRIHEGCNARAWVHVGTEADTPELDPANIFFVTDNSAAPPGSTHVLTPSELESVSQTEYEVFEPMAIEPVRFYAAHNEIKFYTWGDHQCCLPQGAMAATLVGELGGLKKGDVLIFEEVLGPMTGSPDDADPAHRHAVRLTLVEPAVDRLFNQPVVRIEWAAGDALPFPLCLSTIGPAPDCKRLKHVSFARGNVILVDHGRRLDEDDKLGTVSVTETRASCEAESRPGDVFLKPDRFRPHFRHGPLTFSQPLVGKASATGLLVQDPREAVPQILKLISTVPDKPPSTWSPRSDLLASHAQDLHFTVEIDDDGLANLRFGDGDLGRMPEANAAFVANYRVGNGIQGNVGEGSITHLVMRKDRVDGLTLAIRNPMPARGGTSQEALADIKLLAPHAFRTQLERATTPDDYARLAERDPRVQRAAASLRWTGNRAVVRVAIDPIGTESPDAALLHEIRRALHRYRRIGHDLEVVPASYVAISLEMTICVLPAYLRGHVKAALLDILSNRLTRDGTRGFFHPDNLTFGDNIYVSRLVAVAQKVTGVESVTVSKLERLFEGPNQELQTGVLPLGPLEVARLDGDPNRPENGRLKLNMRGGR
jgi:hypothetical protein